MELLHTEFLGRPLRLEGSMAGWQQLYWDNTLVSQIDASEKKTETYTHQFKLSAGEEVLLCQLD
ncbi:site-2 protease family protein, partial [Vibrio parahaemolyticus]